MVDAVSLFSRPTAPTLRRGGLRLTARLAAELFLLAVAITAAAAWTAYALVERTFERQLREELGGMLERSASELDLVRDDVGEALAELEAYLRSREAPVLELLLSEGPGRRDVARPLMHLHRLDLFDILNESGVVLSSGHQPERIGLVNQRLAALQPGSARLRRVTFVEESHPAVVERRVLTYGTRHVSLAGGRAIDAGFLARVAEDHAALLVVAADDAPRRIRASVRVSQIQVDAMVDAAIAAGPRRPIEVGDAERGHWLAAALPLGDVEEEPVAWLVVGVGRERMDALLAQMIRAFVILGAVVGLVAALAGVWIARGISRPIRDLVTAFDAIAAGEADYSLQIRTHDEIQEVVMAFSRLQRLFELQRRRSMAAERVAAWREVARHVAHEVKNPLAPIRLTVENLLRARERAPERFDAMFQEGMRTILEEVQQLSRMVGEFAEFARLPLPERRPVEISHLLDRVVELYASEPGVEIRHRVDPRLPRVALDEDQISRALKNVMGNAIDAVRETQHSGVQRSRCVEIEATVDGDSAQIVVSDDGPGLSDEAARRLFEPYFTTKAHGTGLGLALTYRIVIEHGGSIYAENRPEGGARVVMRVPLEAADAALSDVGESRA